MSLNEEERSIMVQREFQKAMSFMHQAEVNASLGEWDVVANRLYYSAFHAVSALLIKDGRKAGTHKGNVLLFGQHYVCTGAFSPDDGRFYSQLQTIREKADYTILWDASDIDFEVVMSRANQFIQKVRNYLGKYVD